MRVPRPKLPKRVSIPRASVLAFRLASPQEATELGVEPGDVIAVVTTGAKVARYPTDGSYEFELK
jgi:hypothetical protein